MGWVCRGCFGEGRREKKGILGSERTGFFWASPCPSAGGIRTKGVFWIARGPKNRLLQ